MGPLLYDIFSSYLYLFVHDILVPNYEDHITPFCNGLKISNILIELEDVTGTLLEWFQDNRMKANWDKYHHKYHVVTNSKIEKSLRVKIEHELKYTNADLKSYRCFCLYIKNMPKFLHYNSIYFLSYAHPRCTKCLFTNIQKQ